MDVLTSIHLNNPLEFLQVKWRKYDKNESFFMQLSKILRWDLWKLYQPNNQMNVKNGNHEPLKCKR